MFESLFEECLLISLQRCRPETFHCCLFIMSCLVRAVRAVGVDYSEWETGSLMLL